MKKSWHLDRRSFLRGSGASLALPFMDCMGAEAAGASFPSRFCAVYFPYGVSLGNKKDPTSAPWRWFPEGEGRDFTFNNSLAALEPLREDLSILGGMSHRAGRSIGGHDTADIWLTGTPLKGRQFLNSVSLDQQLAEQLGAETRFRSLTLSVDGGVGSPTRSSTLSFSRRGQPVPALNQPRLIYNKLFGADLRSREAQLRELTNNQSMLDRVLVHSHSVRRRLGKQDQNKFDEYLSSVRQIEQRVERSEAWLDIPKPQVSPVGLHLDANDTTPGELIKTLYDLLFLAFQTDSTRVATYQLSNMNGATSLASKFPQLLGFGKSNHSLAHGWNKPGGAEALGKWDQFRTEQLAYFLTRLKETREGDGCLLDRTTVLYGSSNSNTHNNRNYPTVLAGGGGLGLQHGQYLQYTEATPFANVHHTLLRRHGVAVDRFADSTGELPALLG